LLHALALFALILWVLAFVQTLVNLRAVPRLKGDRTPIKQPLVSVVIPARNEGHIMERTVRAFLAQDYPNFELIVVDDRSTDSTADILRAINDPRLTVIEAKEAPAGWLGKPWALEEGKARARGDLLLFVDADLIYAPPAIRAAVEYMEGSGAAMVALLPHFEMPTFAEQVAMPMLAYVAFCGMPLWYSNRSRAVRLGLGAGAGNLIRRDAFESIGAFTALKDAVVDDIGLAHLARRGGYATRVVRADDLVTVRMYDSAGGIVDGFTKNIFFAIGRNYFLGALVLLLMGILHLLPYALAFAGDVAAVAVVILISLTRVVLFRSLRYSILNAIFLHPLMVGFWVYIFLRSMWLTGVRKELRWRGRTYDASGIRTP
jgi:chlorobactene glucosyltransferase